jgi:ketosteroid isomerase-like protein
MIVHAIIQNSGLSFLLIFSISIYAQSPEKDVLLANAQIDEGVVKKDIQKLELLYGDDFVFTHGTGFVEGKASWLKNVQNPEVQFISRAQDSTKAEMHGDVAILIGRLDIVREQKQIQTKYGIWYVRVFVWRKGRWQLISHRTTKEWH